jgi:large subunit ribosomal protein L18
MKRIKGSPNRPRLSIFRSNRHIYAQVIDDKNGKTLFSLSTLDVSVRNLVKTGQNCEAARIVGKNLAQALIQNNLVHVVLDRRFKPYHGRIEALAEGAREGGLEF